MITVTASTHTATAHSAAEMMRSCPAAPRPAGPVRACALAADARAGAAARTFTSRTLREWCADDIADDLLLAVAELFANALRHGSARVSGAAPCAPILLELVRLPRGVLCLVSDSSPVFPGARVRHEAADGLGGQDRYDALDDLDDLDDLDEGGRGLQIVGALAAAWGCVRNSECGGKSVWALFELTPPSPPPPPGPPPSRVRAATAARPPGGRRSR
ncbi:MAG: ATP-binding protein [Catenulispora sp.]|nr:ATP-binding protein [Catenulispora sp.]